VGIPGSLAGGTAPGLRSNGPIGVIVVAPVSTAAGPVLMVAMLIFP
jgi:hypothetical protein